MLTGVFFTFPWFGVPILIVYLLMQKHPAHCQCMVCSPSGETEAEEETEKKIARDRLITKVPVSKYKEYNEYLASEQWSDLRLKIMYRDGFKCKKCNTRESLQVHHKDYRFLYAKNYETDFKVLITVCKDCHQKIHKREF